VTIIGLYTRNRTVSQHVLQTNHIRPFSGMLVIFVTQLVIVTTLSLLLSGQWDSGKTDTLHPELNVAGIPLGGLTEQEAAARLQAKAEKLMQARLTLTLAHQSFFIDPKQIKLRYNVQQTLLQAKQRSDELSSLFHYWNAFWGEVPPPDLPFSVQYDHGELTRLVESISRQVNRPAVSASAQVSGKAIAIVPEQAGIRVQVEKTLESIVEEWKHPRSLTVPITVVQEQPALTQKQLQGLDTLLAEEVTAVDPGVHNRMANALRAASLINGTIVLPDQVFSFNESAAPYRKENGYEPVPVLEDEEIPDGVAGGAVQVASTLYVAAVKSHLTVIERHNNRSPVGFLPIGCDAFVREPDFDLRFVNRTKTAIYIHAEMSGNRLFVAIFGGKNEDGEVTIETEQVETFPPETIVRKDINLRMNEEKIQRIGRAGLRAKVFAKWKGKDGKTVRRQLSDDYYKPLHNIVLVGPKREGVKEPPTEENSTAGEPAGVDSRPPDIPLFPEPPDTGPAEGTAVPPPTSASDARPAETKTPAVRVENGVIIVEP
jgi:vancomycin resistance protein YoaR